MKFRNYCIVVLGETEGSKEEISKIAETDVKYINAKGLVMGTFSSVATPSELKEYFQSFNRNFFLFELGEDNYGVNLTDNYIHQHLFGEYETKGDVLAEELSTKLFKNINQTISGETREIKTINIEKLNEAEKNVLLNEILDKGVDNWNDEDKSIINKLSKK